MTQENLLKRLTYRSGHRGCKETDLIFGKFAELQLHTLSPALLATYEQLLDEDDADIWAWVIGKSEPANPAYGELIEQLKAYGTT